jgi:hypothetical protein
LSPQAIGDMDGMTHITSMTKSRNFPVEIILALTNEQAARVEEFRRRQTPIPSRREALRALIEVGLREALGP